MSYYWDKSIRGGTCIDETQFYRWTGVANLLIDLLILSLSVPMIWRLNLPDRQKASLTTIFLLGAFVFIASVLRVVSFDKYQSDDLMYTGVAAAVWTDVEQSTGILCACLPCMRPLFGRVFGPGGRMSKSQTGGSAGGGALSPYVRGVNLANMSAKHGRLGRLNAADHDTDGFARLGESPAMVGTMANATANGDAEGDGLKLGNGGIVKTQSGHLKYGDLEGGFVH